LQLSVGTVMVSDVVVAAVTAAGTPPTRTIFPAADPLKFVPAIVALWPSTIGLGVTDAICGAFSGITTVTVMFVDPDCPSELAVIVAVPAPTPVTSPVVGETVAILALLVAQVTARPVSTFPAPSRVTAVAWVVCPAWIVDAVAVTVTEATGGGITSTSRVPVFPSTVAEIVADPAETPVTSPLLLTVAIDGGDDVHVTVRPVSAVPAASRGVAVSCAVWPMMMLPAGAETETDATAGGPEESPPHPAASASVHTETTVTPRRAVDIGFCR